MRLVILICIQAFIILGICCNAIDEKSRINSYATVADEIVRSALTDEVGYHLLAELAAIGPRLAGSENAEKAVLWAKSRMEEIGLDKVTLQSVTVPVWERGDVERARIISRNAYNRKLLHIASLGGSIGTPAGGLAAEVIEVRNFEELRQRKEHAWGKIVFFNRPMDQSTTDNFSAYGEAVSQRTQGPSKAAKAGGVAAIVRSVTTKYDNVPHVGTLIYEAGVPKVPAVAIGLVDADFLSEALSADSILKIRLDLSCRDLPEAQSYNVIGEITGSEKPEEVIVVGGHIDSWDVGDGSHDDGAGCVQALEVLDLFKRLGLKPKRTVRAVFFMNEEYGLSGARVYGDFAANSEEIHVAAIEADRGAFTPRGFNVTAEESVIKKIQSWLPALRKAKIEWVRRGGSGADISSIQNARALIGFVPDVQRYFDFHHSANDVFEAVHPREFELGSAAMAILAYLISEEGL